MDEQKIIIVLEGPAGSGKSTVAEGLIKEGFFNVPRSPLQEKNVRDYGFYGDDSFYSQAKDLTLLSKALSYPHQYPMIDRFFLSQMVYGALRAQQPITSAALWISHLRKLAGIIQDDYIIRKTSGTWPMTMQTSPPDFFFIILLPTVSQLIYQRKKTGKRYPFAAADECFMYSRLTSKLGWCRQVYFGLDTSKEQVQYEVITYIKEMFQLKGAPYVSRHEAK